MAVAVGSSSLFLKSTVRYCYAPLFLVLINGLIITTIFYLPISLALKGVVLLLIVAVAIILARISEQILPYNTSWNHSYEGDTNRDIVHFFVNESLSIGPSLLAPILMVTVINNPGPYWPSNWPLLLQLLFAITVFDLIQNLFHWAAHRWPPLWKLHAVHHQVKRMYGINGILKHPLYQILSGSAGMIPLVLLGMPKSFTIAIAFLSITQLLIQHSNVDYKTGPLKFIISSAEVHRFHHLKGKAGDVNFGMFFSFWDHLFGNNYYVDKKLQSTDIGLNYENYPASWHGQMMAPFLSHTKTTPKD